MVSTSNIVKNTIVIRGTATSNGRFRFYFKDKNGAALFRNRYWFTDQIVEGMSHIDVGNIIADPTKIHCYTTIPEPFEDTTNLPTIEGWPTDLDTESNPDILWQDPVILNTSDILGTKTIVTFYTAGARFEYNNSDGQKYYEWGDVSTAMMQDEDLTGFGSLMITSDYSIYIDIPGVYVRSVNKSPVTGADLSEDYMAFNFMVDSWLAGDQSASKEGLGSNAPYFKIPIYTGDTIYTIAERIDHGFVATSSRPYACDALVDQINTYFNRVSIATNLMDENSFTVITTVTECKLQVDIATISDNIQHQISCFSNGVPESRIQVICNSYFIGDNVYELRSYYDMYGIDKPVNSNNTGVSTAYQPLAFGFKFNLDYITEYSEAEVSSIDFTPIPGQSSAKTIGIDATGCMRDITIGGTRVDNSNIWMFHVPWQEQGKNKGIIYTGTSNWGWVKFFKATLGAFQMLSGPYRLVMMTVPSSAQMQYYPTRDGKYQYADGTYVLLAGWEDMCYVMVENFTYSRSEDMFNAIQYNLKLKRVAPLLANR